MMINNNVIKREKDISVIKTSNIDTEFDDEGNCSERGFISVFFDNSGCLFRHVYGLLIVFILINEIIWFILRSKEWAFSWNLNSSICKFLCVMLVAFITYNIGWSCKWYHYIIGAFLIHGMDRSLINRAYMGGVVFLAVATTGLIFLQLIVVEANRRGRRYKKFRKTLSKIVKKSLVFGGICTILFLAEGQYAVEIKLFMARKHQEQLYSQINCVEEKIFANNQAVLSQMTEEKYAGMTNDERSDVLYELAQLESIYLTGEKDKTLHFRYEDIKKENVAGYYEDSTNTIVADVNFMDSYQLMIGLIAHESYHRYEFWLINGGKALKEKVSEERVDKYRLEFKNYVGFNEDAEIYSSQLCEQDAYKYEEKTQQIYVNYIRKNFSACV